jgi:hypothetical protein
MVLEPIDVAVRVGAAIEAAGGSYFSGAASQARCKARRVATTVNCPPRQRALRFVGMAPRTKPVIYGVPPEVEADLSEALAQADRGEGVKLTEDELKRWAETGEWPESLD